jgi:hypothetical protein
LDGTGAIHTSGKPILDADISVDARKGLTGSGKVYLTSSFSVPVQCEIGQRGLVVKGTAPRQASVDTPLALYTFTGDIEVSGSGTGIKTTAKGSVDRKGKIGGMVSKFGPLTFDVDTGTGEAKVNVGGSDLVIDLW